MGYRCNAGLQSDNMLDCSSSFSSENVNKEVPKDGSNLDGRNPDRSYPDGSNIDGSNLDGSNLDGSNPDGSYPDGSHPNGSNSDGLWSDWEEIFLRLDQQDGVQDGRILRSSLSS